MRRFLTDEQITSILGKSYSPYKGNVNTFARAIEAAVVESVYASMPRNITVEVNGVAAKADQDWTMEVVREWLRGDDEKESVG